MIRVFHRPRDSETKLFESNVFTTLPSGAVWLRYRFCAETDYFNHRMSLSLARFYMALINNEVFCEVSPSQVVNLAFLLKEADISWQTENVGREYRMFIFYSTKNTLKYILLKSLIVFYSAILQNVPDLLLVREFARSQHSGFIWLKSWRIISPILELIKSMGQILSWETSMFLPGEETSCIFWTRTCITTFTRACHLFLSSCFPVLLLEDPF